MTSFQKCYSIVYFIYVVVAIYNFFFNKEVGRLSFEDINKEELIPEILRWCITNIQPVVKRKSLPVYKVDSCNMGSILGSYEYKKKLITIYPNKHDSIESIVDSCIHEYVHHLQIRNQRDNTRYCNLTHNKTYLKNDLEIEARSIACKFKRKCMKDLNLVG